MTQDSAVPGYKILGVDDTVYGPIDLPTLIAWVGDERVIADTWVCANGTDEWMRASRLPELAGCLHAGDEPDELGFRPGSLRRVRVLADLNDEQILAFAQFMQLRRARQWEEIVRQNEDGDAMYLVLEGELRVRLTIDGREKILTTLGPGEFFGEVALFDRGPRSADVVANTDSTLLKITAGNFERLVREAPQLAAPFLHAIGKTLVARIRADNKRYRDTVVFGRAPVGE